MRIHHCFAVLLCLFVACTAVAEGKVLKVYVMAGQSNMEGHAHISTFDYIGDDPKTAPLLAAMRGPDGEPRTLERTWISYQTGDPNRGLLGEASGKLTAGYGAMQNPKAGGRKIGPEFLFGITMQEAYDGPILIIKTAWGGKSLNTDFRPPSAGPYELAPETAAAWAKHPNGAHGIPKEADRPTWLAARNKAAGVYYRLMMEHVQSVLADPARVCPAYDAAAGYELAGFVWFQGWNDMVDRTTYPTGDQADGYAEYTRLMSCFIRDVRKEWETPKLPFVIGVLGVDGDQVTGGNANLRAAMRATAEQAEFAGNVTAVETAPFWDFRMAALEPRKKEVEHVLQAGHLIAADGFIQRQAPGEPGWRSIGSPPVDEREWRYISVEPSTNADALEPKQKKRFRHIALPANLRQWTGRTFNDRDWNRGSAPIGVGAWPSGKSPRAAYHSDWGKGEFILMRSTFELEDLADLDFAAYRLAVLSRQGFEIYLNGQLIHRYVWWQDRPFYRAIPLSQEQTQHLREGKNVLAVYANVEYDRDTEKPFNTIDVRLEGISQSALDYVTSDLYRDKLLDTVVSREDARILSGMSNGAYHYLGSAKIMAQIGQAFAKGMLEFQQ